VRKGRRRVKTVLRPPRIDYDEDIYCYRIDVGNIQHVRELVEDLNHARCGIRELTRELLEMIDERNALREQVERWRKEAFSYGDTAEQCKNMFYTAFKSNGLAWIVPDVKGRN